MNNQISKYTKKELPALEIDQKAWAACEILKESHLMPDFLVGKSTADIYMIYLLGRGLGFDFMQSICNIYAVQGRPSLYVRAKKALVLRAGGRFISETYDQETGIASCTVVRDGIEFTGTFSVDEAISRGKLYYDKKSNSIKGFVSRNGTPTPWCTDWVNMLKVRACGRACDTAFADVLIGLGSFEDDVQDWIPANAEPEAEPAKTEPIVAIAAAAAINDLDAAAVEDETQIEIPPGIKSH